MKNRGKWTSFGPQNGPQNKPRWRRPRTGKSGQRVSKRSCVQEGPGMPQDGPEEPKIAPNWPKKAPKIAPRCDKLGQAGPRLPQNCSKKAQKSVKMDKALAFALPSLFLCFSFAAGRVSKRILVLRSSQDCSRRPRGSQDCLKLGQKGYNNSPMFGQVEPRWPKIAAQLLLVFRN